MYQPVDECTVEPVTLDELKDQLNIVLTDTSRDTKLTDLISSARASAENKTKRYLRIGSEEEKAATYKLPLDTFPLTGNRIIKIFKCPVTEIVDITYYDLNNDLKTLDESYYDFDTINEPARIKESPGHSWPSTSEKFNAVIIQFKCGYQLAANVPHDIKRGILMIAAHLFENPADVVTGTQVNEIPESSAFLLNDYIVNTL